MRLEQLTKREKQKEETQGVFTLATGCDKNASNSATLTLVPCAVQQH
jgi:hypothetical protein